eukprot:m.735363 g.735363  ORF g.735363 m.735363 type:complete len:93 (-) comp23089_c0_seq10:754-1032(-)
MLTTNLCHSCLENVLVLMIASVGVELLIKIYRPIDYGRWCVTIGIVRLHYTTGNAPEESVGGCPKHGAIGCGDCSRISCTSRWHAYPRGRRW